MNSTPPSASVRRTALKSVMKPGAPACLPQLVGEGLEVHEILQPLFDRTAEPLADEGAVDVALVEVDDVVDRRALGRRHTKLRSSGITHIGLRPAWTRRMLSKALRNALAQFSHVGPAVCGVIVMVSTLSRGLSFEGGSSTITSRPAPAMRHLPSTQFLCCQASFFSVARISMTACSATATELAPPLLAIGTPALRAASRSSVL